MRGNSTTPVARKVTCHQQDTVHDLCQSGKCIWLYTQTCHLVGVFANSAFRSCWCNSYTAFMKNTRSRVRVGCNLSKEFSVTVGVHQGSCLSPLLFITVLEALSQEFCTRCSCVQMTWLSSLNRWRNCKISWSSGRSTWKEIVNMGKTNVLTSGPGLDVLQKCGKDPCTACPEGVHLNCILCGGCSSYVHKKCRGTPGPLKTDSSFRCKRCTAQARPIDSRQMTQRVGRSQ